MELSPLNWCWNAMQGNFKSWKYSYSNKSTEHWNWLKYQSPLSYGHWCFSHGIPAKFQPRIMLLLNMNWASMPFNTSKNRQFLPSLPSHYCLQNRILFISFSWVKKSEFFTSLILYRSLFMKNCSLWSLLFSDACYCHPN